MGEVYRATDAKLGRDVALKVLPVEMARDPERLARFQREARAVAALNHPHIVTVFSVEEAEGVHFLTMELVEGQALDCTIPESGLPVDRILEIATALSEALGAAHEKGIVHRDLKPANVMVSGDGRVKILDFGLAKDTRADRAMDATQTSDANTKAGLVMGTPAYMSPEQVAGRAVDHRSDIFSLGIILYEMATGRRPFQGNSPAELASAILRDAPPAAASIRPDLPSGVQKAIESCLQKDPAARPQSARDIRTTITIPDNSVRTSGANAAGEQSIAVLPFKSLSPDPNDEFFADGVTEEILNALSQISGLRVAGRSSAFSFKGRNEDLRAVGAKLNVATVLEGTLRRSGERLRITSQLIDAHNGYQLWSERYDQVMEDVFTLQDEIARKIAERLRLSLASPDEAQLPPTRNLAAYELYLKGRSLLYQRGLSIGKAIECFKEAVALDPAYADAWAGLADGYTTSAYSGFKTGREVTSIALDAARRALQLDPNLAEAHNALAAAALLYELDFELAEREFKRALELNPNYPQALAWYGLFFLQWVSGRDAEAREVLERAHRLDPLSAYTNTILCFSDLSSGRFEEAVQHGRKGLECDPNSYLAHWSLMVALAMNAQYEEAVAHAEQALAISGRHNWALTTLVCIYATWGKPEKALAVYREVEARSIREYIQPTMLAPAAAAVGELDRALEFAQQAVDEKDPMFVMLVRKWPTYASLRKDPRFSQIVSQLRLPGWTPENW